ncbi:MAG TPA: MCP four helix bundle domain-containing protein, partial [Anaerolineales bacterium]
MKWFINLSTRAKLILGFGVMWLLLAIVIVIAYVGITNVTQSVKDLHDNEFTKAIQLRELKSHQNYNRSQILDMLLTPKKSNQEAIEKAIT